jgi:hypothetical protein
MSLQQQLREAIAAACTRTVTVDGVNYPVAGRIFPPDTISPLDAWPVWQRTVPLNYCAQEVSWFVLVALPPASAETYIALADAFSEALCGPLQNLGKVVAITPVQLTASDVNAPMACLQFELTT